MAERPTSRWICASCPYLETDKLGEYDYVRDTRRHCYCTNFPRQKREIFFSIFKKNNDPKWCPKKEQSE